MGEQSAGNKRKQKAKSKTAFEACAYAHTWSMCICIYIIMCTDNYTYIYSHQLSLHRRKRRPSHHCKILFHYWWKRTLSQHHMQHILSFCTVAVELPCTMRISAWHRVRGIASNIGIMNWLLYKFSNSTPGEMRLMEHARACSSAWTQAIAERIWLYTHAHVKTLSCITALPISDYHRAVFLNYFRNTFPWNICICE